ncbi:MAG: zinc-ribbon domain-containing protein, partial [Bacteroidales bacterium]|nr:zinc-ribbon domain-containing protein [Bacteroidales bacterium]
IIVLFFWGNATIFIRHLKKQFAKTLGLQSFFEENLGAENFSGEQTDWLNDPNKCPACGATIKENDLFCPECGLKLKQNRFTKDLDTTKYRQPAQNIVYHYKKKEDKK